MTPAQLARIPDLSPSERATLGAVVLELLKEIEDHTLVGLREHGMPQCATDLEALAEEVWRALDPLLSLGPDVLYGGEPLGEEEEGE